MRTLCFFLLAALTCNASEMRGIWVDAFGPGFKNKAEVKCLIEDCRRYNFNAVFVQMRKRGDAYYTPRLPNPDVRALDINSDYDALAELVKQCHTGEPRIEVHCWVLGYFVWAYDKPPQQKEHIFNLRPDLLTTDSLGQRSLDHGYYLDPGHPEVGSMLRNVAKDIVVHYDIDGFHWDYLRYPAQDSGYNKTALQGFKRDLNLEKDPVPNDPRFSEWRRKQITDFLQTSSAELHAIKPNLVISVSVFANYLDSRNYRMADWVEWAERGVVDLNIPMDFTPDFKVFQERVDFAISSQKGKPICIGQGAYYNTIPSTIRQLSYCRDRHVAGTVFYSYRNPSSSSSKSAERREFNDAVRKQDQIIVDDDKIEIHGKWQHGQFGKHSGTDYLYAVAGVGTNSAVFKPALTSPGAYAVYEWHVAGTNRSASVPHIIYTGSSSNIVFINQRANGSRWNHLGDYMLSTNGVCIAITDKIEELRSVVTADAIRFVRLASADSETVAAPDFGEYLRKQRARVFAAVHRDYQPNWVSVPSISSKTLETRPK